MNILTFDIEEWYLEKKYFGDHSERYKEFDFYLDQILNALDKRGFKGTFFCVGGMATDFPDVVRKIDSRGHEIGCHSFKHVWLNKMNEDEVLEDTRISVDELEQCIGKKIRSYRAPAFSIGKDNKWVFEILSQCGITRDASIFPAERDFGGFTQFGEKTPTLVFYNQTHIKEFPICTTNVMGKEIAYSGGGYFRFFPLSYVKKEMNRTDYAMTYFHISDLVPESSKLMTKEDFEKYFKVPGTLKNRFFRYIKTNLGKKKAFGKLLDIIATKDFMNLDWEHVPSVVL